MFIGGESLALPERERKTIENPASGQPVDTVPVGTAEDVDRAVQAANAAFIPWWETSAARRGEFVHRGARLVAEHIGDLSRLLTDEQGKPLRESRLEIHRFVLTLEHYAGMAKNLRGAYVPNLDKDTYGLVTKRPLGVVGAIVPWNFPTTLLSNKLAPALVAGNTMVAKPADTTPLTTLRIAELLHEAGLPKGVFNVVTGRGLGRRRGAGHAPDRAQDRLHRLDARRRARDGAGGQGRQAADARARRLRPVHRAQGRRPRRRRQRRVRRPLLQLRPGLPRGQARVRGGRGGRRVHRAAGREGAQAEGRAGHDGGRVPRPAALRAPARGDRGAGRGRPRQRRGARRRRAPRPRDRLLLRADDHPRAGRATRASPARRSSARCCRSGP